MRKLKYQANCQECGKPAKWRSNGINKNLRMCEEHKILILEAEARYKTNTHVSEADRLTWEKL